MEPQTGAAWLSVLVGLLLPPIAFTLVLMRITLEHERRNPTRRSGKRKRPKRLKVARPSA